MKKDAFSQKLAIRSLVNLPLGWLLKPTNQNIDLKKTSRSERIKQAW